MKRIYERLVKDTPLSFNLSQQVIQAIEQPTSKVTRIEDDRKEATS